MSDYEIVHYRGRADLVYGPEYDYVRYFYPEWFPTEAAAFYCPYIPQYVEYKMSDQEKEVRKMLSLIAEGYPVTIDFPYIIVENPDYTENGGQNPNLVFVVREEFEDRDPPEYWDEDDVGE